jgi:hypothetical protein
MADPQRLKLNERKRKRKNRKMFNQFLIELHFPFLFLLSFNKKREIKIKKKTIQRKIKNY